jgi:hypothetical protein
MATLAEQEAVTSRLFEVVVIYNGLPEPITVNPEQTIRAVLDHAIKAFNITAQPHLLGLFTEGGAELADTDSVEKAGVKPGDKLLLRPSAVRAGYR